MTREMLDPKNIFLTCSVYC